MQWCEAALPLDSPNVKLSESSLRNVVEWRLRTLSISLSVFANYTLLYNIIWLYNITSERSVAYDLLVFKQSYNDSRSSLSSLF